MTRSRTLRHALPRFAAALVPLLAPPARAQLYQQPVTYTRTDQSIWGTGTAASPTYTYRWDQSWNSSKSIGGIAGKEHDEITPERCALGVCIPAVVVDSRTGSEYRAYAKGSAHFDASTRFTEGTIDIDYRAQTGVQVLTGGAGYRPGDKVSLVASWTPLTGSSFITTPASVEARARFGMELEVGATGTVCGGGAGCDVNGGEFFSFDTGNFEIASLNWGGQAGAKVFGLSVPGLTFGRPVSPGDVAFGATRAIDVTFFEGYAVAASGEDAPGHLSGRGQAPLLFPAFDPVKLAAERVNPAAYCLVSCSRYGFGYELAGNRFGPYVQLRQDFDLEPGAARVTYEFSAPVQWKRAPYWAMVPTTKHCSQVTYIPLACLISTYWRISTPTLVQGDWSAEPVTSFTVPADAKVDVRYPDTGGAGLAVSTSFAATAKLRNTSRLVIDGNYSLSLLKVTTPDGDIGPVYRRTTWAGSATLPALFDKLLDVDLGTQVGASFLLPDADPSDPVSGWLPGESLPPEPGVLFEPLATPEPGTLALVATSLGVLAAARRRRAIATLR
jgi:hypothetical protein